MHRILVVLVVAVLVGVGASSVQGASPSPSASPTGTILRVGLLEEPDSLNPFIAIQTTSHDIFHLNYDRLVRYDADALQPVPGLATRWSHSPDGKTWTFWLRRDVTWQDGRPFTADDVVFTYRWVIDTPMSSYVSYTDSITSVTALDKYTVVFKTSKPKADMLQMWVPIMPKHVWAPIGPTAASKSYPNNLPIIGTGPFQVVEWKRGSFVRLVANKHYWGGAPKVSQLIFVFYTNPDTMAQDLRNGTIQWARLSPSGFTSFASTRGFDTHLATEPGFDDLGFNCYMGPSKGNPVLRDPAFRRALAWAIDRNRIAQVAYSGAAIPATSILPANYYDPHLDYHWQPGTQEMYDFDPAKAEQLLDAAGYKLINGKRCDKHGKPITLRLWTITDKSEYDLSGKMITQWLHDIGLGVTYQVMDEGALNDRIYNTENGKLTPDYDLFLWNWDGDFDPGFLLSVLITNQIGSWSDTGWSNAAYDRLYQEQATTLISQKRLTIVRKMEQIVHEQCPYIPLVYPEYREVFNTAQWSGWIPQPAKHGSVSDLYTYLNVHPLAAKQTNGSSSSLLAVICAIGVVAIVGGGLVWRRLRPARAEED